MLVGLGAPVTSKLGTAVCTSWLPLFPLEYVPMAEPPDDEYPLILTTGRVLEHWHGGTMTRHSQLDALYPEALLELNEVDAEQHGLRTGDVVRVSSRRGSVVLRARV